MAQTAGDGMTGILDGEVLRDPTRPAGASLSPQETRTDAHAQNTGGAGYRVSFIRAGGSQPMAVINGQAVRVGEEVSGAQLLSIETGTVILKVNGEDRRFSTWQGEVVRQSASGEVMDADTMNREHETDN
jgi:hypothetical protein